MTLANDVIRHVVACHLRAMRKRVGLSQEVLAMRMGSHRPIVCRMEQGKHTLEIATIRAYVHACGGELSEITQALDLALLLHKKVSSSTNVLDSCLTLGA